MKKLLTVLTLVATISVASAQQFKSKNGHDVLPAQGDWSIAFDAAPFVDYAGKLLSGGGGTSPTPDFANFPMVLQGKLKNSENSAYRAMLRIGMLSQTDKVQVADNKDPKIFVEDATSKSSTDFTLGAGMEYQRGYNRLIGHYGADVMLGFGTGTTTSYTYGNPTDTIKNGGYREIENNEGGDFMFGISPLIGVEYFFAPKMSVGAEFNWHINFTSTGETVKKYEAGRKPVEVKTSLGGSKFEIDSGVSPSLTLAIWF